MWKLRKIIETIIIFIIIMLVICFAISFGKVLTNDILVQDLFKETGLYFLYTIGYGSIEGNQVLQNILAMIGIVSLALMSTFLTINLFWRMDDVKFNKNVIYKDNSLFIDLKNNGRVICDVKISFMLYDTLENTGESKEYYIPILIKKAIWHLKLDLNETFWYKVVFNLLENENKKLYAIYSFVDTKSGQSSIKVEVLTKDNIIFNNQVLTLKDFLKPVIISKNELLPIENGGSLILENTDFRVLNYKFKSKKDGFVMAYYNFHQNFLNLEKYIKDKTYLSVAIKSDKKALVILEIKRNTDIISKLEINTDQNIKNVKISVADLGDNLEDINEVCYTVFSKDNLLTNKIYLSDLVIQVEQ